MKFSYDDKNRNFSILDDGKIVFNCNKETRLIRTENKELDPMIISNAYNKSIPYYIEDGKMVIFYDENECLDIESIDFETNDNGYITKCKLYFRKKPKDCSEIKCFIQRNFDPILKYNEQEPNKMLKHVKVVIPNAKTNRSYIQIEF